MDVSVIFATYNRADIIAEVLEAWRKTDKATKYKYEIICSDDESTDQTVQIIETAKDLPIQILRNKKGGAGKARNAALKIAQGKIVIFTGDDMFPEENFVNAHYENYLKFGRKTATLGRIEWHNEIDENYLMHHITHVGCEQFGFIALPPNQIIDFRHFYTSNISVAKSELDQLMYCFDEAFDKYGFEDIELGYRLQKNGLKIYYDPDIQLMHHHIYNSVYKFCNRQLSAGEELVVFHGLHTDLEDKCIIDVENCRKSFELYCEKQTGREKVFGKGILALLSMAKKSVSVGEKFLDKRDNIFLRNVCSFIYASIFRYYFYYGCSRKLAEKKVCSREQIAYFTYLYLKKGFHEVYYDIGHGFNEEEARKWICWDDGEKVLEKTLPEGVKAIRFSPLKNQCKAKIEELYFETEHGKEIAKIDWHNSCQSDGINYDFTNTNDPQILVEKIPPNSSKLVVKVQVKDMKKKTLLAVVRKGAGRFARRLKGLGENKKEWNASYEAGQPRKIQILVGGLSMDLRKNLIHSYQVQCSILGDCVVVSDIENREKGYIDYIYQPKEDPLDIAQILQVIYCLLNCPYDYVIVSKAYEEYPIAACKHIEDIIIYSALLQGKSYNSLTENAVGRFMRLPSFRVVEKTIDLSKDMQGVKIKKEFFLVNTNESLPSFRLKQRTFAYQKSKPVLFVIPIFLAVGGVERNTIEVMRSLKDEYEFCLITMEKHQAGQGSLHHQLKDLCNYIFDLREITEFDHFLDSLFELKKIFNPDLVWLCNNSPWFEDNSISIRNIFANVPVVMQDVYDTKVGWIEYYGLPSVMCFDRFIAITELIKTTFMEKYKIAEEKIDVIYPVVDKKRILEEKNSILTYEEICKKYGLDEKKEHFSTIGRIADQKNPIRYLKMIQKLTKEFPQIQFIMVGDGNLNAEVGEYIEKHAMQADVIRIPYISNALEFTKILDGLIILSHYEGMPIVSIEAMSFGVPIMSTDVGDLKRFLLKSHGGMIVDETKSDSENFKEFYNNLSVYNKNSIEAADEIIEFFSAEYQSKQYKKCFDKGMQEYTTIKR